MVFRLGWKAVFLFLIVSLLLATPFLYQFFLISDIYIYKDIRAEVLNSVFLLRENYGITIGDLTISRVDLEENLLHIHIREEYHGLIDKVRYNQDKTLERTFNVLYAFENDSMWVESIDVNK